MLKQSITFVNFADQKQQKDLYFNITRTELAEMARMEDRFKAWGAMLSGEPRDLSNVEILELLNIIRDLIDAAYGERSPDGTEFDKSPAVLKKFKASAAYDAFLWELMTDTTGQKAVGFMTGILPKELAAEIAGEMGGTPTPTPKVELGVVSSGGGGGNTEINTTEEVVPAYMREMRLPTQDELQKMNRAQLAEAMKWKSDFRANE